MIKSFESAKQTAYSSYLAYFFICLPPAVYFVIVSKFALNLPYYDDYLAVLNFLNDFKKAGGVDKFFLLFSQHNAHRIFFTRLVIATYYFISGNVNFRNIIFIGNTQLLFILLISVHFIKKALPAYWELPSFLMSLFIFDISSWQNADWAMASVQNYSIILLFLASLYFYSLNTKAYAFLGALFQITCTFSSGNGIVASLCVMAFTILNGSRRNMIFSVSAFLIFSPIYFIHYETIPNDGGPFNLRNLIVYFFHIISGHIYIGRRNYSDYMIELLSFVYLACLITFAPISKKLKIEKKNLPFASILAFIIGTMIIICRYRMINGPVLSRYLIYCHYITGIVFIFYLMKFPQTNRTKAVSIVFTILMLLCYERNFKLGYGCFKMWQQDVIHNTPDPWLPEDPAREKKIVDESCRLNIYCLEQEKMKVE